MANDYLTLLQGGQPAAGGNPYLDMLQSEAQGRDTAFRGAAVSAFGVNPDQEARERRVASYLGTTPPVVRALPQQAEQAAKLKQIDDATAQAPVLRKQFTDADFARLAHDDANVLGTVESAIGAAARYTFSAGTGPTLMGDIAAGFLQASRGAAGLFRAGAELAAPMLDPLAGTVLPENPLRRVAAGFDESARMAQAQSKGFSPPTDSIVQSGVSSGVQSAVQTLATLPAAAVSGPSAVLQLMTAFQGGGSYQQAREAGMAPVGAATFGASQAVVEYATEKLPIHALIGDLRAGASLMKTLGHQVITEVPGEQVATVLQDLNEWAALNPEKPFSEYLAERPSAAAQTLIATVVGIGAQTGVGRVATRVHDNAVGLDRQAQAAEAQAATIEQLLTAAAASKLRERAPDSFEQFVRAATEDGPLENVYIDAVALQQSGVAEQLAELSPTVAEQLPAALVAGGTVQIPVAELVGRLDQAGIAPKLLDDLRTDPNGMSRTEAAAFMQNQAETLRADVERTLDEQAQTSAFQASRDEVQAAITEQLKATQRFTDDVNNAYGALVSAWYATQAARLGTTPGELFKQMPLRVQAEGVADAALDQRGTTPGMATQGVAGQDSAATQPGDNQRARLSADRLAAAQDFVRQVERLAELHGRVFVRWSPTSERDLQGGQVSRDFVSGGTHAGLSGVEIDANTHAVDIAKALAEYGFLRMQDPASVPRIYTGERVGTDSDGHASFKATALAAETPRAVVEAIDAGFADVFTLQDDIARLEQRLPKLTDKVGRAIVEKDLAKKRQQLAQMYESSASADPDVLSQDGATMVRGQYAPSVRQITLLAKADLSTFLHESGHFFLDMLGELASRENAPAAFGQDMQVLLDWFGVKDLATWRGMTLDQQRESHEKFARGFEAYLFEGKAPSIELQGLFQRFRAWMLNVYRSLRALNVELTDDVRGVMDRMLASTEAIKEMESLRGFTPAFTPEEAARLGVDYAAYHEAGLQATQDAITALESRGLRDMQWLTNARGRELRRLQKLAAAKRKEVRAEVEAEVRQEPIYAVQRFLSHGELTEGGRTNAQRRIIDSFAGRSTKLDLQALKEFYGDGPAAPWRYLSTGKNGLATAQDGLSPDLVAELFGYTSGDHLVRTILAAEKESVLVDALTDQRMLERYGELSSQEDLERAADAAVHNDARARFIATELNALAKAVNVREDAGTDAKGRRRTVAVLPKLGRQFAAEVVGRTKVRDLRPSRYTAAEAKAARAAEAAIKKGDVETAATEKRNQLLNNYAARAALDAQSEVEQIVRYLRRFDASSRTLDADYAEQIDALLERVSLKTQSLKSIDRAKTLVQWVEAQREQGMEPDIPEDLLNEAYRTSYRDMTIEQLRGLRDTVKQIEHLGRLKHKLLTAKEQREWDAIRDEIATSINDNAGDRKADTRTPATVLGKSLRSLREFGAAHIKAATWARIFDGGRDGGPVWEYLVRSANERGDQETTMRAQATEQLHAILAPLTPRGGLAGKATYFPSIGKSLTREQVLSMALNTGNASNLQRLLGGEGWTLDQLQPVLATLTAADWQAVQKVWDHFEQYRPLIGAKERRVYGKEPAWIEAGSAVTQMAGGVLPAAEGLTGGYYPIRYDPSASSRAEAHNEAEAAKRDLQGAYTSATTRRGFTKSRAEEVNGRPLLYSLSGVYSGVNDVIHDLSWHEWLIDANKILRSEKIDRAIRSHYGPEVVAQMKTWVKDIAAGDRPATDAIDVFAGRIRQGVSAAGLSFNVMSAVMQPLGLTQSIVRVGAGWVGRGVAKYIAGPISATREVNEKSAFMRERARTRFRELNELRNMVEGQSQAKELLGRYGYWLMMRCQQMVDVPTWHGAYEKAVAEGNNEDRAVALADQAVIDAQGGGQTKDLSRIERAGTTAKLFTVFYSFMNTAANLGVSQTMTADTPAKKAKLAADYLLLFTVPAVLGALLKDALTPGDSGDDDPDKLMRKMLGEQLGFLMGLMVGVREFTDAGRNALGLNERARDYSGPAGLRPITDTYALAKQVNQGEFDDAFRKAFVNVMGDLFGLPAAQINRTITGAKALKEGETENPAALVFGFQRAN